MTATDLAAGYSAYASADEVAQAAVAHDKAAVDPTTSVLHPDLCQKAHASVATDE